MTLLTFSITVVLLIWALSMTWAWVVLHLYRERAFDDIRLLSEEACKKSGGDNQSELMRKGLNAYALQVKIFGFLAVANWVHLAYFVLTL
jgi:hypothetical protein